MSAPGTPRRITGEPPGWEGTRAVHERLYGQMEGKRPERRETALQRVKDAVSAQSLSKLSDVFYDSYMDGEDDIDHERPIPEKIGEYNYGFDCDDLAAVLLPILTAALSGRSDAHADRPIGPVPKEDG